MRSTTWDTPNTSYDLTINIKKMIKNGFTMEEIISETLQAHEQAWGELSSKEAKRVRDETVKEVKKIQRNKKVVRYGLITVVVAAVAYSAYHKFIK